MTYILFLCCTRRPFMLKIGKSLQSLLYGLQWAKGMPATRLQWAGLPGCLSYSPFRHRDKGRLRGLTRGLTIPNHTFTEPYCLLTCNTAPNHMTLSKVHHHKKAQVLTLWRAIASHTWLLGGAIVWAEVEYEPSYSMSKAIV